MRAASVTRQLAGILARPVAQADRRRAALHVLDWVGCAAAGAVTPAGRVMVAFARSLAPGRCRTVGGAELRAADCVLVNGAVGNVLEMDDIYRTALVHPGPVVVPTALALAREEGASGEAALDAVVRGYEAMIRIGRSVGPTHYRHFHNTATCGVFGSAAAAASLLRLDETATVHALGNAGTQAGGLWQCRLEDTMTKQLHNGRAAQAGLLAARLASHGFTGPEMILEGELGFFAGMCPDGRIDEVLRDPDAPWLLHGCSLKPWPAGRHCHPTIDAALELRGAVRGREIAAIEVKSYRDAVRICDKPVPTNAVEAKFSLQHAAATVLLSGRPILAMFDESALARDDVAALRARVSLVEDEAMSARYPAHFGARVSVTLTDGSRLAAERADALGDPEVPMSEAEIEAKARMLLAAGGAADGELAAIVAAALALAEGGEVGALLDRLK